MDSMNPIDIGQLLALAAFWFSTVKDKASKAEELGQMKQQIRSLETRASNVDAQLNEINTKLNQLVESNARLETQLTLLISQQ
jgi:septal ring factor EnvC (AmiA/AmiB activator)|tara:strand:- start:249 stop:497 length:249 start_codon:yes stop_codon:yes gene_type:complete